MDVNKFLANSTQRTANTSLARLAAYKSSRSDLG